MTVALDIGAHRIRSLRHAESGGLIAQSCRASYAVLPDSPARREVLRHSRIPYAVCEDELALMGDGAERFARLFHATAAPLFPDGRIPEDDAPARQIIAALVESLLPPSGSLENICSLTIPGIGSQEKGADREWQFLSRLVRLRGYTPMLLHSGMAVVLAELSERFFTGIGVDLGAESTELVVAHCGIELARSAVPRGGNWIDRELALRSERFAWDSAGNRYLDTESMREWKETASLRPDESESNGLLIELYKELLELAFHEAARTFTTRVDCERIPQPLAVVCSGGPTRIAGFDHFVEPVWRRAGFPLETDRIRIAADDEYRVARGCLLLAELQTESTGLLPEVA